MSLARNVRGKVHFKVVPLWLEAAWKILSINDEKKSLISGTSAGKWAIRS